MTGESGLGGEGGDKGTFPLAPRGARRTVREQVREQLSRALLFGSIETSAAVIYRTTERRCRTQRNKLVCQTVN
jgi:hypothetical protein